ncbi:MAG TPA: LysM domain-containing protein [Chthoniobacteraceae bacterium]|jgi:hypothetical protein|nr:LysM domain-containing protein [Chthoniobacteraceae bacterium]
MSDPHEALQAMLQPAGTANTLFPPNSRYCGLPIASLEGPDGGEVVYLRRRFVPAPESFATVQEHVVVQGERLDHIAARYLGDPEQFWRLCDANGAVRPDVLTGTIGRRLRITLPEGIPGIPNA